MEHFKRPSKLFFSGLFFLLFFSFFNNVFAQTDIYSNNPDGSYYISENTTWTKEAGPYVIYDNVVVEAGATLTIKAGTVIKPGDSVYFDVFGHLLVNGTANEKVYFTSQNTDSQWGGLEFIDGGDYEINNSDISHAQYALGAYPGNGSLNYVSIHDCDYGIFIRESNVDIRNSTFSDITNIAVEAYSTSSVSFTSSDMKNIGDGFHIIFGSTLDIFDSSLKDFYGGEVFEVFENSSVNMTNVLVQNADTDYVAEVFNDSSMNVTNSTVDGSFVNDTFTVFTNSHFTLASSTIKNNMGGSAISFFDCRDNPSSTMDITDSLIDGGTDIGLEIFCPVKANIKNTKIKNFFGDGIQAFSFSTIKIEGSEITGNNNGIMSWGADFEIKNSTIKGNKIFGISNNPADSGALSIKAVENWWGDASGPFNELSNASGTANQVSENVEFAPWLLVAPGAKSDCCSNVVLIPGLQASRLYSRGTFFENQLWEPNRNADVKKLYLDSSGESVNKNIYTNDIIKRTNIGMGIFDQNVYKKFSDTMDSLVNEKKINGWEALPYDWRFDINKIVKDGSKMADGSTLNFVDEIIKNASLSATGKVTIVTHSNGGLIAKALINELKARGKENLVDKLIMVAAPQLGTPEAIAGILHGDGQDIAGGWIVEKSVARTMGENMMGAYNLLPEDAYFTKVLGPIIKFDSSVANVDFPTKQVSNFVKKYGNTIVTSAKLRDFLLGVDGRSEPSNTDTDTPNVLKSALLTLAQTNHSTLDVWTPPENIKVVQLAGWGVNTLSGIKYSGKDTCAVGFSACVPVTILDREPIYTEDGDKTVVSPSATAMDGVEKFYLNLKTLKNEHSTIFEATSTMQFVTNLVLNENQDISKYITVEKPISINKTLELSLHSPVSISVYDSAGNHTGLVDNPNPNSDMQMVEENIPGSRYDDFGEGKYVLLDESNQYSIKLQGLDVGTFTLNTKVTQGGVEIASSSFVDIPTNPSMIGEVFISTNTASTSPIIKIDADGDGKNDFTITASQEFDPIIYLQILRKTVETFDASKKTKDEVIKKIDSIIKSLQKNKTKIAISKIKSFSRELSMKTKERRDREEKKHKDDKNWKNKKHKLAKDDAETLLAMLSQLLDNLMK